MFPVEQEVIGTARRATWGFERGYCADPIGNPPHSNPGKKTLVAFYRPRSR